jgi:hypothetical protein
MFSSSNAVVIASPVSFHFLFLSFFLSSQSCKMSCSKMARLSRSPQLCDLPVDLLDFSLSFLSTRELPQSALLILDFHAAVSVSWKFIPSLSFTNSQLRSGLKEFIDRGLFKSVSSVEVVGGEPAKFPLLLIAFLISLHCHVLRFWAVMMWRELLLNHGKLFCPPC